MGAPQTPAEVQEYLDAVEGERGDALRAVFETVQASMPAGYELGIQWGMPGWVVPLERYPNTYNKQALAYVSLAAQKNYLALYLLGPYSDPADDVAFRAAWKATGLKLDMGKSCLRFRRLSDVDLGIIASTVASTPVDKFLADYERSRS